ncbi:hypothetical protein Emed_007425 [Eimeria media]
MALVVHLSLARLAPLSRSLWFCSSTNQDFQGSPLSLFRGALLRGRQLGVAVGSSAYSGSSSNSSSSLEGPANARYSMPGGGLAASPFYLAHPNPAFSSPFHVVEEGPPEILRSFVVRPRAPLPRPVAASAIFLILVSSIGAAVAFLLATCFRRFRSRGTGEGLQVRALAEEQQQPWGGHPEEYGEDEAFLSQTLDGCLELESELGLAAPAPQLLPPTEDEAVKSIASSLQEAALMFEGQQTSDGFLGTSLSPNPEEAPQPLGLTAQADDHWSGQRTGAWQEGGSPLGPPLAPVPTPPTPPQGAPHGASGTPALLSLLQQQRRPSRREAAAAEVRAEKEQAESKRRRRDTGGAVGHRSLYALLQLKSLPARQQEQDSSPGSASTSSRGVSPSLSLGSPEASISSQSPESGEDTSASSMQPSSLEVGEGSITIVSPTGEKITFPHPPLPTPPNTPLHYRLPSVPPEAVQTVFLIRAALPSYIGPRIWDVLNLVRTQLRKPVLNKAEVTQLMIACRQLLKYLLMRQGTVVESANGARAVERLSMRYLCFEALVNCVQLIGPPMKPEEWFPQLVAAIPTNFKPAWLRETPASKFNNDLAALLRQALTELKAGRRASLELTEQIKKSLFTGELAPPQFKPPHWDNWRSDFEEDKDPNLSATE